MVTQKREASNLIRPPIFIFSDELLTFESVETAELYLESWSCDAETVAFDVEGHALQMRPGNSQRGGVTIAAAPIAASRAELMERLRAGLADIAQARPDLLTDEWVRQAPEDDLVDWCRRNYTR